MTSDLALAAELSIALDHLKRALETLDMRGMSLSAAKLSMAVDQLERDIGDLSHNQTPPA